jgi:TolA-binding protein
MLASGLVDEILRDATARGIDRVISRSTAEDLEAFADAARYRHRYALARQILGAARRRFPGSSTGQRATYLMARIAQANGDPRSALSWYETYLQESPRGTFASECLGSKVGLTQRLFGDVAARPVADEYLRRFPSGTYSAVARALIER